jgi:hypothetical protein
MHRFKRKHLEYYIHNNIICMLFFGIYNLNLVITYNPSFILVGRYIICCDNYFHIKYIMFTIGSHNIINNFVIFSQWIK